MAPFIRNIVFAFSAASYDDYKRVGPAYAEFYAELLGMRIIREDWIKIAKDPEITPQLGFGDGPGEYPPVRWPDPTYPQQLHLNIAVPDLDAADELVTRLGATPLQDKGHFRTYADPIGHPFCLYRDNSPDVRIARIVIDCPDAGALAVFYGRLLEMPERIEDSSDRVVISRADRSEPMLAFQRVDDYRAPRWPDPEYPQQVHLDVLVDDGEAAYALARELGGTLLPAMGGTSPVYADPAGHPLCIGIRGQ